MTDLTPAEREAMSRRYRTMLRLGVMSAVALAVLSVIEYVVATALDNPTWWLMPFIVLKGLIILQMFMHFSDLWKEGAH